MVDFYEEFKKSFGFTAVVSILAGMLLLIYPQTTSKLACYLLGAIIIVQGVLSLVHARQARKAQMGGTLLLVWGLILIGLGGFIVTRTEVIISIIPLIFGLFILASGIGDMLKSKQLKDLGYENWWVTLLITTIKCVLGAVMIFNPFSAAVTMLMFMGGCLIYGGISTLWTIYCLTKNAM